DGIFVAEKLDESLMNERELHPIRQELRYRGFSEWYTADSLSPKLPDYSEVASTRQRWRDLEGFHTRFGDVSELLADIDDRYVIMNAGDELLLTFEPDGPVADGMARSFVFVSDGWIKDGDYNTGASATVHPLPYHGQRDVDYGSPGSLYEDPVFQRFRDDWAIYHTRYVTPHAFRTALVFPEP
ncbi:MAG: hypothetical protein ACNA78_11695, partial [Balneolaceae bacterium]